MRQKLALLAVTVMCAVPAFAEKKAPAKPAGKVATAKMKIEGMHCQGCAGGIVNQLMKLKGVKEAKVDAKSKIGQVKYDPAVVKPTALVERVKVAGFQGKLVK